MKSTLPPPDQFGVYLHIPFCSRRCDYCAFATWDDRGHLQAEYMAALLRDVEQAVANGLQTVDTVFVGGGTPSLVDPDQLMSVINALSLSLKPEITIECNPDNVSEALMHAYKKGGATRISLGVQSMRTNVLKILGREHNPENVRTAVEAAKAAGIEEINLDLIYGSVGESIDDVRSTIGEVVALQPTHVSAYGLTVEPGTPLSRDPSRFPDDDDEADKYLLINSLLEVAGYANYEISNWSRQGSECRHNLLYWRQGNYLGFGCAAHSHVSGRRSWNVRTPDRYIDLVASGESREASFEDLSAEARTLEALQLALRMRDGISENHLLAIDLEMLEEFLIRENGRIRLNPRGRLVANEIAVRLVVGS